MTSVPAHELLLVEDDENDIELAKRALKSVNLLDKVHVANNGKEALDYILGTEEGDPEKGVHRPLVVLLDLKLPVINGLEVLKKLKSDVRTAGIPIVILTSSKESNDLKTAYAMGANSYIVKPYDLDDFTKAVSTAAQYWLVINEKGPEESEVEMSTRKPRRVLFLEDTDEDAELLERRLRDTGLSLELRRVVSKAAYLDGLENFAPDIIISDYKLADIDGDAVFNLARERKPDVPFIILSGTVDDSFASRMLKSGVSDFILKDRPERLGSAVERALVEVDKHRLDTEYKKRTEQLEVENEELRQRMLRIKQLRDELEGLKNELKRT